MTPKEKAKQLIDNYGGRLLDVVVKADQIVPGVFKGRMTLTAAKQCALIAVEEVVNELNQVSISESGTTQMDYGQSYWNRVKEEINEL